MPTYEYLCDGCGHRFDEFQSIKADALKTCPQCKEDKLRRLIGPGAALLFKGSGFYQTDYRSKSYQAAAKADKEGASAASKSESGSKGDGGSKSDAGSKSDGAAKSDGGSKSEGSSSKTDSSPKPSTGSGGSSGSSNDK